MKLYETNDAPTAFPIGITTVTWTATDGAGNTATCTQVVTVTDVESPVAIAQDITVSLDASGNATLTPAMIDNGSSDNCTIASWQLDRTSFDCSDIGTPVTVVLTVVITSYSIHYTKLYENQTQVNISSLNAGLYLVKIYSENGVGVQKIIKK